MHYSLTFVFYMSLIVLQYKSNVNALHQMDIQKDLSEYNLTCPQDSCEDYKLLAGSCRCDILCVRFGTCCWDSYYIDVPQPNLKHTCRSVYNTNSAYFMIDHCPAKDNIWAGLCNAEWDGDDNVQKIIPVTSLLTSITYKNYYCFRCHEKTDEFMYWKVQLMSYSNDESITAIINDEQIFFTYNISKKTWMVSGDENGPFFTVQLSMRIPDEISKLVHYCEPDVISNCSDEWTDEDVRVKCLSYMAKTEKREDGFLQRKMYRNIHCALCNFESLDNFSCGSTGYGGFGGGASKPFSFFYLLDINRSDGELVGRTQKCPEEDSMWDPFSKKCRKLSCALPGYIIKNRKCVPKGS